MRTEIHPRAPTSKWLAVMAEREKERAERLRAAERMTLTAQLLGDPEPGREKTLPPSIREANKQRREPSLPTLEWARPARGRRRRRGG